MHSITPHLCSFSIFAFDIVYLCKHGSSSDYSVKSLHVVSAGPCPLCVQHTISRSGVVKAVHDLLEAIQAALYKQ